MPHPGAGRAVSHPELCPWDRQALSHPARVPAVPAPFHSLRCTRVSAGRAELLQPLAGRQEPGHAWESAQEAP
uniref:Uncharacterized protein n=1 Tax=Junco hyemalis TaxID=40217 RepID=A0A8C5NR76_JUNHY